MAVYAGARLLRCVRNGLAKTGVFAGLCLAVSAILPAKSLAQNLYVSNIDVYYATGGGDQYCIGQYNFANCSWLNGCRSYGDTSGGQNPVATAALIEYDQPNLHAAYPAACLALCATLQCVNTQPPTHNSTTGELIPEHTAAFGVDELTFEVFKFQAGANPLDPGSAPPIRTIPLYNVGTCPPDTAMYQFAPKCAAWDGYYNIDGEFGKTNGQFGFRAHVKTNQSGPSIGNITIEQTSAYPGQNQYPITVNVTDIHSLRSSPTVVGKITPVAAEPYNIQYRLSKDAVTSVRIETCNGSGTCATVRNIATNQPRFGEGTPNGTLANGDSWDGRNNAGDMMSAGNYIARIAAYSNDDAGQDIAYPAAHQISMDPLQITDFRVKSLGSGATDLASVSYMLTESATVYMYVYPADTTFGDVNTVPPTASNTPIYSRIEAQPFRQSAPPTMTTWDGRDNNNNIVEDGDYIYAIWASMPGCTHTEGDATCTHTTIYTQKAYTGIVSINRGFPAALLAPSSTVIGSSPSVSNVPPYQLKYSYDRTCSISLQITTTDGTLVRTLLVNSTPVDAYPTFVYWDGKDDDGNYVDDGMYMAVMQAQDPLFPGKTFRSYQTFPVGQFRMTDVVIAPLLGNTTAQAAISYLLSNTLHTDIRIYPPGTIVPTAGTWPPTVAATPVKTFTDVRPGKMKITEVWDGLDPATHEQVADGLYPVLMMAYDDATPAHYVTDRMVVMLPIARGPVYVSDISMTSTVIGSSPALSNQPPFNFIFSYNRPCTFNLRIFTTGGTLVRDVLNGYMPADTLQTTVPWDGMDDQGRYVSSGTYVAELDAADTLDPTKTTMSHVSFLLDQFRLTDLSVTPLLGSATSQAGISYMPSQTMNTDIRIYPPGTQIPTDTWPPPYVINSTAPVKTFNNVRPGRLKATEYWDGMSGNVPLPDGLYPVVVLAYSTAPVAVFDPTGVTSVSVPYYYATDRVVQMISIARGPLYVRDVAMTSSVAGSSPAMSNLNPFTFSYSYNRPCVVDLQIRTSTGALVRDLLKDYKPGDTYQSTVYWDGLDDAGRYVSSGTYVAALFAYDVFFPTQTATSYTQFSVDMFRITDLETTPLLGGTTSQGTVSYMLSQTMNTDVIIYPPGTQVPTDGAWPPAVSTPPVMSFNGVRPERLKVTEFWDGVSTTTHTSMPDGLYPVAVLAYSTAPVAVYDPFSNTISTVPYYYATDRAVQMLTVSRGPVYLNDLSMTATTVGSSPAVSNVAPFTIKFSYNKPCSVDVRIITSTGALVRDLIIGYRPADAYQSSVIWDGRDDLGRYVSSGTYAAEVTAYDSLFPAKTFTAYTYFLVDQFRITDISVLPLLSGATAQGAVSYMLSQTMNTDIRIYPPGTQVPTNDVWPPVISTAPVMVFNGVRPEKLKVTEFWDGISTFTHTIQPDGLYPVVITAYSTAPVAVYDAFSNTISTVPYYYATDRTVYMMTVARGPLYLHDVAMTSSVAGSSPALTSLAPFTFNFSYNRPCSVDVKILTSTGAVVRDLIVNYRPADSYQSSVIWDGRDDLGRYVSSGTYMAELTAYDVFFPTQSVRSYTYFNVDQFRLGDVYVSPLLGGTTAQGSVSYLLSQTMNTDIRIYPPGTQIATNDVWPPAITTAPVMSYAGVRPERLKITEFWDGVSTTTNTTLPDGLYPVLVMAYSTAPVAIYDPQANTITQVSSYYATDRVVQMLTVSRGPVYLSDVSMTSTVAGSSPSLNYLPPYTVKFSYNRPCAVDARIITSTGALVRDLVIGYKPADTAQNSIVWDGKDDLGRYVSSGTYAVELKAYDVLFPEKVFTAYTYFIADQYRITDIAVSSLLGGATAQGSVTYLLGQTMATDIRIYPPGTQIATNGAWPPAITTAPVMTYTGIRPGKMRTTEFWDGISTTTHVTLPDGLYPVLVMAYSTAPVAIYDTAANTVTQPALYYATDRVVEMMTVSRGPVYLSDVALASSVAGSSPALTSLAPFTIGFSYNRPCAVDVRIITSTGALVRDLAIGYKPADATRGSVSWDGRDDLGRYVSSGTYGAEITAYDALFPEKTFTAYVYFPVDQFRITDIAVSPLLSGATAQGAVSYLLSQTMNTDVRIYPPGTQIPTNGAWPPVISTQPVMVFNGVRPERLRVNEFWDGVSTFTHVIQPDGLYPVVVMAYSTAPVAIYDPASNTITSVPYYYATDRVVQMLTIARGPLYLNNVAMTSTVAGASPTLSNLPPFNFSFSYSRPCSVDVRILTSTGALVRDLVSGYNPGDTYQSSVVWDGRDDLGRFVSSGTYMAELIAYDVFFPTQSVRSYTYFIADQFRISDVSVAPLLGGATAQGAVSYLLGQTMATDIRIYPPGTQIATNGAWPPVVSTAPVMTYSGVRPGRLPVSEFWDGVSTTTNITQPDGLYPVVVLAYSTAPVAVYDTAANTVTQMSSYCATDRIVGMMTVSRGPIYLSEMSVLSTVAGSTPSLGNLPPYTVKFAYNRDCAVNVRIITSTGALVRDITAGYKVADGSQSSVVWDGRDDMGRFVSSGTYAFQLTAYDSLAPAKVFTAYSYFVADQFRIVDVAVAPLLGGATAQGSITYLMGQTMNTDIRIYPPGTQIPTNGAWPPAISTQPVMVFSGVRPEKLRVTEFWDGVSTNTHTMQPDGLYPVLLTAYSTAPVAVYDPQANTITQAASYYATDRIVQMLTVSRGPVYLSDVSMTSTVAGSSPALSYLPPYTVKFSYNRPCAVSVKIVTSTGALVREIVSGYQPADATQGSVSWDGRDDLGRFVSSGTYGAELTAYDTLFPDKTFTAYVYFQVDQFRISDLAISPLLSGATAQGAISYLLSQTMNADIRIYPPGTQIPTTGAWPPAISTEPVMIFDGVRPEKMRVTEYWDGVSTNTHAVQPDGVYPVVIMAYSTAPVAVYNPLSNSISTVPYYYATDRIVQMLTVARGPLYLRDVSMTSSVTGSSPVLANLPPFGLTFSYNRSCTVDARILTSTGALVRDIINGYRPADVYQSSVYWDGRDDAGRFVSSGTYIAELIAYDVFFPTQSVRSQTYFIADQFRLGDVSVSPLLGGATAQGSVTYLLSQTMNADIRIYPPGTKIATGGAWPPAISTEPVMVYTGARAGRLRTTEFWDGVSTHTRTMQPDGIYPVLMTAYSTAPVAIYDTAANTVTEVNSYYATDRVVEMMTVSRGPLYISDVSMTATVVGASPSISNLAPFTFRFALNRAAVVDLKILTSTGAVVKDLLVSYKPVDSYNVSVQWDGTDDLGRYVSSGTYTAEISAYDAQFPEKTAASYTYFLVDQFRIIDASVTPLLGGTTSQTAISYLMSQMMNTDIRVYPPGTAIPSAGAWPPVIATAPVKTFSSVRPGRLKVTELWDGYSGDVMLADGLYPVVMMAYSTAPVAVYNPASNIISTATYYYATDRVVEMLQISRGPLYPSDFAVTASVLGSSPEIANLPPYSFRFAYTRQCAVGLRILTSTGAVVRDLTNGYKPTDSFQASVNWDGINDNGYFVSSGTYTAELVAYDTTFPDKVTKFYFNFLVDQFRITDVSATPLLGGASAQASITYMLNQTMNANIYIYPPGTAIPTAGVWPPSITTAPVMTFIGVKPGRFKITEYWDGIRNQVMEPDGLHPVVILAYSTAPVAVYNPGANQIVSVPAYYATDRIVAMLPVTRGPVFLNDVNILPTVPNLANSSDTVKLPPYQVSFTVTRLSSVTISAIDITGARCTAPKFVNNICKHINAGSLYDAGVMNREYWDGTDDYGQPVSIGAYQIQIVAYNYPGENLQQATTYQNPIDVNPFQVYDIGIGDITARVSSGTVAYQLSLPMKTAVQIFKPGIKIDPATGAPRDPLGNAATPIKVLSGIQPMQSVVHDIWDGTDTSLRPVPDGNYVFRIVSSTDSRLVDWVTGDICKLGDSCYKDIRYVADIKAYTTPLVLTVSRGAGVTGDVCDYFGENTVFYPNPLRQSKGCFDFGNFVPVQGDYSLRIYNIAGESVYSRQWYGVQPWTQLWTEWNRVNDTGNQVARGVYFAVLQLKSSTGSRQVCQVVRKLLLPDNTGPTPPSGYKCPRFTYTLQ
ncbi:MAG: FlgD immunoglobulin-like domain containing protein [Elusimicrobiales bacterium]